MRCPLCSQDATASTAKPFCSDRCRSLDLGKWLDGSYRFLGEHVDVDSLPDRADAQRGEDPS